MELTYEDQIKLTYYLQELTGLGGNLNRQNRYYHGSAGISLEMSAENAQLLRNMENSPEFLYHDHAGRSAIKVEDDRAIEVIENNLDRLSRVMRQARRTLKRLKS